MSCLILTGVAIGCASPAARMDRLAEAAGYERSIVEGAGFRHVVYAPAGEPGDISRLHVYLGSDGTPWVAGRRIAADPTPRNPVALGLMSADPGFAAYIGRPCYLGMANEDGCTGDLWTEGRYSRPVIDSLAAAISGVAARERAEEVLLIGYSGGGTLAVLLAPRIERLAGVITVAGNLDVAGWSERHGYLPLSGSLDPAALPVEEGGDVPFVHLVGAKDQIVPRELTEAYAAGRRCHAVTVLEGYDHACCWEDRWPELLRRAEAALRTACEKQKGDRSIFHR